MSQFLAGPAAAQFQLNGNFTGAALDAGWSLSGDAALTAPALDPNGNGALRLTGNKPYSSGRVAFSGGYFTGINGLTVSFDYAAWGGGTPGGDGIAVFLYDATKNMEGALPGGAFSYCKGSGGYIALALDAYGNFSNPATCAAKGGPGLAPQSFAIRGPTSEGNPFIAGVRAPNGIDAAAAATRPAARRVVLTLTPRDTGPGYWLTLDTGPAPDGPFTRLMDRIEFPYASPNALSLAVSAATGGAKNVHEIRNVVLRGNARALPLLRLGFSPQSIPVGAVSTLTLSFSTSDMKIAALTAPLTLALPEGLTVSNPPIMSGNCMASLGTSPNRNSLTIGAGSFIRKTGCDITVSVKAAKAGQFPVSVPSGGLRTDAGANVEGSTATLTVGR